MIPYSLLRLKQKLVERLLKMHISITLDFEANFEFKFSKVPNIAEILREN